jgi:sulfite exporter TauE/SafE/copper chaperone CopZ
MAEPRSRAHAFTIDGMTCAHCEVVVERILRAQPDVTRVDVRYDVGRAVVEAPAIDLDALNVALREEGYEAHPETLFAGYLAPRGNWMRRAFEAAGLIAVIIALVLLARHFHVLPQGAVVSENMTLGLVFVIGLVASVSSCMAVTGGLLLALAAKYNETVATRSAAARAQPHIYFNAGRLLSYTICGAVIGALGAAMMLSPLVIAVITVAASALMILIGVQMLGLVPPLGRLLSVPKSFQHRIHDLVSRKSKSAAFALGAATFFLPCGFTLALQLYVLGQGSALTGALTMLVFALGTLPALASLSALSSFVRGPMQGHFLKIAGAAVIVLGVMNIQYGLVQGQAGYAPTAQMAMAQEASAAVPQGDVQIVTMTIDGLDYRPNRFRVKVGKPVEWHIDARNAEGCGRILVARSIGLTKFLSDQKEEIIRFTPQRTGEIAFNCSMGMMTGNSGFTVTSQD